MYIRNGIHFALTVFIASTLHTHGADLVLFEKNRYQAPAGSSFALLPSDVIVYCVATGTNKDTLSVRATCRSFAEAFLFVKNQLALDLTLLAEPVPRDSTLFNRSHITHQLLLSRMLQIKGTISLETMNSSGFKLFCHAINHLTTLDLWNTNIGAVDAQHLSDALTNNSSITILNVSSNKIGTIGAQYLSVALINNNTLTHLDLGGNNIGAIGAQSLSNVLKKNTTITTLYLGDNKISAVGVLCLSDALTKNNTLTTLSLRDNNFGVDGARSLSDALKKNSTLTVLNLEDNNIRTVGVRYLSSGLTNNTSLTKLYY